MAYSNEDQEALDFFLTGESHDGRNWQTATPDKSPEEIEAHFAEIDRRFAATAAEDARRAALAPYGLEAEQKAEVARREARTEATKVAREALAAAIADGATPADAAKTAREAEAVYLAEHRPEPPAPAAPPTPAPPEATPTGEDDGEAAFNAMFGTPTPPTDGDPGPRDIDAEAAAFFGLTETPAGSSVPVPDGWTAEPAPPEEPDYGALPAVVHGVARAMTAKGLNVADHGDLLNEIAELQAAAVLGLSTPDLVRRAQAVNHATEGLGLGPVFN